MADDGSRIRILIVDDHTLFRESVARLLAAEPDFTIAGHCASADEALRLVAQSPVDVVLLDYDLGEGKGTAFLARAHSLGFTGRVLVVTAGVTDLEAAEMIRRGIAGILPKHCSPAALAQSIRDVHGGKEYFEPGYLRSVVLGVTASATEYPRKKLTDRERQVLHYVFEGLANKEIADRLQVSESSVKATLQQLFSKTGVRTRSQLVRTALENYKDQL
ncbi:MAG: response regulator transcription factor [Bryobacteraceae bacterium]|jgi:two-component system, NarL family, nitrate/nitrite response regulator NarL